MKKFYFYVFYIDTFLSISNYIATFIYLWREQYLLGLFSIFIAGSLQYQASTYKELEEPREQFKKILHYIKDWFKS